MDYCVVYQLAQAPMISIDPIWMRLILCGSAQYYEHDRPVSSDYQVVQTSMSLVIYRTGTEYSSVWRCKHELRRAADKF